MLIEIFFKIRRCSVFIQKLIPKRSREVELEFEAAFRYMSDGQSCLQRSFVHKILSQVYL